jgi:hypothetical protein
MAATTAVAVFGSTPLIFAIRWQGHELPRRAQVNAKAQTCGPRPRVLFDG